MAEAGRRFERLGRAALAERWELAVYELDELDEALVEMPRAAVPKGVDARVMKSMEHLFSPSELGAALAARDASRFAAAFGRAAANCNACHQATAHAFIDVPATPGAAVPNLDRAP